MFSQNSSGHHFSRWDFYPELRLIIFLAQCGAFAESPVDLSRHVRGHTDHHALIQLKPEPIFICRWLPGAQTGDIHVD